MELLLCLGTLVLCLASVSARTKSGISVGAIRWDAWFGYPEDPNYGIVARTVAEDLSFPDYSYRLPFFASKHDPKNQSRVYLPGNTMDVMNQDLMYASKFGIDYFAYCTYPIGCADYHPPSSACPQIQCCADNYGLSYALLNHLASPHRALANVSLILQANTWFPAANHGGNETVEQECERFAGYFADSVYHKVLDGRPLVFILGSDESTASALATLTAATKSRLNVEPYYVLMGGRNVAAAQAKAKAIGAQALSNYVVAGGYSENHPAPYRTGIADLEAGFWNDTLGLSSRRGSNRTADGGDVKLLPPVTVGWDPRPRGRTPVPWGQKICPGCYVEDPTMPELESHTKAAARFALDHPDVVESKSILLSAYNENDEGHWLTPTLEDGTQKLTAIKAALDDI